jgi:tRNA-modifying protein YgfZ
MSAAQSTQAAAQSLQQEHEALHERCGLLDRSQRGRLALSGSGAAEFLNGQVTNDVQGLQIGEGCYAAFLTHKGKMLGDLRILRTEDELLLDTERVALQSLFDMIRRFKVGYDVELHKRTLETALLSLIGPESRAVAERAFRVELPPMSDHDHLACGTVRLVATDVGLDVICDAGMAEGVAVDLQAAGAIPVGEEAAEILRVESGRPRYGVDLDETVIPQEAGLNERAVSFTKGCYVGQETVARLYYKGKPNRLLRGLQLPSEPLPMTEPGTVLKLGDRTVGSVGSAVSSPALGRVGLALLRREAAPGDRVTIGEHGLTATVVELPFAA